MTESESQTRRDRIDGCLKQAGWENVRWSPGLDIRSLKNHAVGEYPTANGPADSALIVEGNLLGIVGAKKLSLNPSGVLAQAERYSQGVSESKLNYSGFRVPFLYATNGELIRFHDVRDSLNVSRPIAQFHTPAALKEFFGRDLSARSWFQENPPSHSKLRDYQKEANTAIEEAISNGKRQMLVAMATGTGKTFTAVNQCYRLLKSKTARRILFLVDRRALAAQAVRAFSVFEPEPNKKFDQIFEVYSNKFQKEDFGEDEPFDPKVMPRDYLLNPQPKHTFVYVCTVQRMAIEILGRQAVFTEDGDDIDEDAEPLNIPIHAFDLLFADECHRGYTSAEQSTWRAVLDYYDSIRLGLTATPASHTKAYFKDVVFRYTYDQAVREGHLVDWELVKIKSNVRINGVFLKEGETIEHVDLQSGARELDALEDHREFAPSELERLVTSPDSNRKILLELKKYADAHEKEHGRFPKTLIFAANDLPHASHADELAELAREIFGRGEGFVQKITGRVDRPLQKIREFRNRPKPGIAITVDLLSTGVDVPCVRNIVFFRYLESSIVFHQMVGRGTRIDEASGKLMFRLYDYTNLIRLFGTGFITPPRKPRGGGGGGGSGGGGEEEEDPDPTLITKGFQVQVGKTGHFVLGERDGQLSPIAYAEYKAALAEQLRREAATLTEFRSRWIAYKLRHDLMDALSSGGHAAKVVQMVDALHDCDLFDVLAQLGYQAKSRTRLDRRLAFQYRHEDWLDKEMPSTTRQVVMGIAQEFERTGTDGLESTQLWHVPSVEKAGGMKTLLALGTPAHVLSNLKYRLFSA